jgi:hypothetical protein
MFSFLEGNLAMRPLQLAVAIVEVDTVVVAVVYYLCRLHLLF